MSTSVANYVHGGSSSAEADQNFVYPVDVTLKNLATVCKLGANPGPMSTGSFTFDLKANGVATGLSTVCDTSTWVASDTTHTSALVTAGQFVTLRSTAASSPFPNTQLFASWQTFAADGVTPLVMVEGGGVVSSLPSNGQFCDLMRGSCNASTATAASRVVAVGFVVDKFAVTMGSGPTGASTETYCLRNVTTGVDIVCAPAIASPNRVATSPACSSNCSVNPGDEITMRVNVSGSGHAATRHFAIHVTGASTQILYSGTSATGLAAAGPIGLDFTSSPQLAIGPVATAVRLRNLYSVADSAVTKTLRMAASSNCDNPDNGGTRPTCAMAGATTCSDSTSDFTLSGIGCMRVEQPVGGTGNVRLRGGIELQLP